MARGIVLAFLCLLALSASASAQSGKHLDPKFLESIEDAQLHGTVTPPGADTRHATTEIAAYDGLVQAYPKLTEQQLRTRFFKDRLFGPIGDPERTYKPRARRDRDPRRQVGRAAHLRRDRRGHGVRGGLCDRRGPPGAHGAAEGARPGGGVRADRHRAGVARGRRGGAPLRLHRGGVPGADRPAAARVRAARARHRADHRRLRRRGERVHRPDAEGRGARAGRLRGARRRGSGLLEADRRGGGGLHRARAVRRGRRVGAGQRRAARAADGGLRPRPGPRRSTTTSATGEPRRPGAHHPPLPVHGARRGRARPALDRLRRLHRGVTRPPPDARRRAGGTGRGGADQDGAAEAVHAAWRGRPVPLRRRCRTTSWSGRAAPPRATRC